MKKQKKSKWMFSCAGKSCIVVARNRGSAARIGAKVAGVQLRGDAEGWFRGVTCTYLGEAYS